MTGSVLAVRGGFRRALFYTKLYADFYANFKASSLFWLIFYRHFHAKALLFCLIITMMSRGTLKLQCSCSARLIVYFSYVMKPLDTSQRDN